MSTLDVPVYITETGVADRKGDKRPIWLQTYIPEVSSWLSVPSTPDYLPATVNSLLGFQILQ